MLRRNHCQNDVVKVYYLYILNSAYTYYYMYELKNKLWLKAIATSKTKQLCPGKPWTDLIRLLRVNIRNNSIEINLSRIGLKHFIIEEHQC